MALPGTAVGELDTLDSMAQQQRGLLAAFQPPGAASETASRTRDAYSAPPPNVAAAAAAAATRSPKAAKMRGVFSSAMSMRSLAAVGAERMKSGGQQQPDIKTSSLEYRCAASAPPAPKRHPPAPP